ncbi:MAG: hypothetical protein WBV94_04475 [Blastocatellia bacterium]
MKLADRWVEIFRAGPQMDSKGQAHQITADFLDTVVRNYDPAIHEAPAVIGHPADNAPAYAWTKGLRVTNGILEAQFGEVEPTFEEAVINGRFKKRSASFYLDTKTAPGGRVPSLRHVGFLGAQPPAVKGLRDIQFDEGESITFDFSEGETMKDGEKSVAEQIMDFFAEKFGRKDASQSSFSEADRSKLIADVVKQTTETLTTNFSEQLKEANTRIEQLTSKVTAQGSEAAKGGFSQFVESLGPAKLPQPMRPGLVEFMEAISGVEAKITVISFSEADGKRTEKKEEFSPVAFFKSFLEGMGPFIEFGERFGGLKPSGSDLGGADENEVRELRSKSNVPVPEKGGK